MRRIFAAMLLFLLAAPAWGQDFEKGVQAYERRDCAVAERELRPLAEQGDAEAQYFLGKAHEFCWVPSLPLAGAAKWYRRAAEQGHADAQLRLGYVYINSPRVSKDYAEAVKWWHKAAEQGHAEALFVLGQESARCGGKVSSCVGLPDILGTAHPEYTEAAKWYRLAAERGYIRAQFAIGRMYVRGLGVPQDYVLAHMWFNLAAAQAAGGPEDRGPPSKVPATLWGMASALVEMSEGRGALVKARDAVAAKMTPDQIAEAQRLAREWKPKKGPPVSEGASQ